MNVTLRNVDQQAYQSLKAQAALEGKPLGVVITMAIRAYLKWFGVSNRGSSLRDLKPEPYATGNERLSEEIDAIVYKSRP